MPLTTPIFSSTFPCPFHCSLHPPQHHPPPPPSLFPYSPSHFLFVPLPPISFLPPSLFPSLIFLLHFPSTPSYFFFPSFAFLLLLCLSRFCLQLLIFILYTVPFLSSSFPYPSLSYCHLSFNSLSFLPFKSFSCLFLAAFVSTSVSDPGSLL
jgi:hypothetical protein